MNKKNISEAAQREEEILKFWKENKIFEKSLKQRQGEKEFVFYDGPPFATGLPHWGSLLSSVAKDVIPRYQTMKGKYVRRRWGWDTHGLPIENMIEKQLNLTDKTDIENKIGIKKFNETCRSEVLKYTENWKEYIDRIGRWVEFDNAYKTMDNDYMESVWHFLKVADKKGLLYEGYKVLNYCPHCQTPIAKAEIAMDNSYQDVKDISVTAKFKLKNKENTFILAWTTTPWTLPGNIALAVGKDITYTSLRIKNTTEVLIVASDLVEKIFVEQEIEIIDNNIAGADLIGLEYEPLFDYYAQKNDLENKKNGWKIYEADFVTTEEGTGVVHIAAAFGEDDFNLGKKYNLPFVQHVDLDGSFKKEMGDLAGIKVKQKDDYVTADIEILKLLQKKESLFSKKNITHSYPHCYRCATPLLNYAISSWFLDLQKDKQKYVDLNEKVNWIPSNLKHGRVKNLLEGAPDWTISRNRYWATPLPFWKNTNTGEVHIIGSLEELKNKTKSTNNFTLIRHGESESNIKGIISTTAGMHGDKLTIQGQQQAELARDELKKQGKKIDFIISSPFQRTKQTAEIIANKEIEIIFDERIKEIDVRKKDGSLWKNLQKDDYTETYLDVKKRSMNLIYELDEKYENKNILLVSHGAPLAEILNLKSCDDVKNAELVEFDFAPIPHNDNYELDLHRPYIDEIQLKDDNGEKLTRVPEVIDCWVESATMPFAEYHYPFENKELFESRRPADFISEYIAQTRTWFNYMHTVAGIMFNDISFKNVITTGNILADDGKKMSKSLGNFTDPLVLMSEISADAARFYMMESAIMIAEDLNFSDKNIIEIQNKVINIFLNSYKFYELYQKGYNELISSYKSKNILDIWILVKLNLLIKDTTLNMDEYHLPKTAREIKEFLADLSKWYIRRSRNRFKSDNKKDKEFAIATLKYVLEETSKIMAPITPFISDYVYKRISQNKESVHLENWPEVKKSFFEKIISASSKNIIDNMELVRKIVSLGLEQRTELKIKVRQPLASIKIVGAVSELIKDEQFSQIIKDELNIKKLDFEISEDNLIIELNTELNTELKEEGNFREFLRLIQVMRKKAGLQIQDNIELKIDIDEKYQNFIKNNKEELKKIAGVVNINFSEITSEKIEKINGIELKIVLLHNF